MCGMIAVFRTPPARDIAFAARRAGDRGPHSHGIADLTAPDGTVTRGAQRLPETLPVSEGLVIAHSRLATSTGRPGTLPDPAEGQPLQDYQSGWTLAHNGHSRAGRLTALSEGRRPGDTHGLLTLLSQHGPAALADPELYGGSPQAILGAREGEAFALRMNGRRAFAHPLYLTTYEGGAFIVGNAPVASRSTLIPAGEVFSLPVL